MWLLFDDAREWGASPRLYSQPTDVIVARELGDVVPALEKVRAGLRAGKHAAGYLVYEAGHAFDPKLEASARQGEGPLLCFGLFDGYETPDLTELLRSPDGAYVGPVRPRIRQDDYEAAALHVREHLFAGDFYQANLTFGCDVAVAGDPLAIYARLRRSAKAGWGGVVLHDGHAIISLSPEQFFTIRHGTIEARPPRPRVSRMSSHVCDTSPKRGKARWTSVPWVYRV